MKNPFRNLAVAALILVAPALVLAQGQASAPERIGVINIQEAIGETQQGKAEVAALTKKYAPRKQQLEQQDKEITALQDRLQNQSTMLSDDEKYQLSRELDQKQRHFKDAQQDAQDDYQADMQEIVRTIGQNMVKLIDQYAQQHKLSLVIGTQQLPVYYASREVVITPQIVKLYDQTYPATAQTSSNAAPTNSAAPAKH